MPSSFLIRRPSERVASQPINKNPLATNAAFLLAVENAAFASIATSAVAGFACNPAIDPPADLTTPSVRAVRVAAGI